MTMLSIAELLDETVSLQSGLKGHIVHRRLRKGGVIEQDGGRNWAYAGRRHGAPAA